MVVLVMLFRIAVNSNPSGFNGVGPKEFLWRGPGGARNPRILRKPFGLVIVARRPYQSQRPGDRNIRRSAVRRCERAHRLAARSRCLLVSAGTGQVRATSRPVFSPWRRAAPILFRSNKRVFAPIMGCIARIKRPRVESARLGRNLSCQEARCFDRLMVANAMSAMNRRLRNSEGTSIIVGGLDRAKAEHEECNRRKGAACAVNSEKIQGLSLHALQPSGFES
jgi:hypothetical protein